MLSRFHILRRGFTNTAVCLKKRVVRPNPTSHRGPVVERPLPLKIIENRDLARKGISSSLESLDIYFPLQPKPTPLELREARRFTKLEERIKPIASTLDYQCLGERDVPEVAFLGRGNVGKSTIINALTGKRIAQPTKKAGGTKLIHQYLIHDHLSLVDLPGYGFNSQGDWGDAILDYFKYRKQLRRVYLLVDVRRGLMELDRNMIAILDQIPISFQVVFTKLDFVFDSTYYRVWKETEKELSEISKTCYPELLGTSAKKNIGIETLALSILRVCKPTDN